MVPEGMGEKQSEVGNGGKSVADRDWPYVVCERDEREARRSSSELEGNWGVRRRGSGLIGRVARARPSAARQMTLVRCGMSDRPTDDRRSSTTDCPPSLCGADRRRDALKLFHLLPLHVVLSPVDMLVN